MATTSQFGRRGASASTIDPVTQFIHAPPKPRPERGLESQPSRVDIGRLLFSFNGRVTRLQYRLGHLGIGAFAWGESFFAGRLGETMKRVDPTQIPISSWIGIDLLLLLVLLVSLVSIFWVGLSLTVRRWHDLGKSGWWALLGFIPIIGWLWQIIECGWFEGTLGPNEYGPSPKGIVGVIYDASEVFG